MYTFILGALDEEIDGIRAAMQDVKEQKAGAFPVWRGRMGNHELLLCRCGVGKANAAAATAAVLTAFPQAARVINTGVAGGVGNVRRGDVVLGVKTVQHDMDCTPDGLQKGQVPDFDDVFFKADEQLVRDLENALQQEKIAYCKGIIASGDRFIASKEEAARLAREFGATACEMESAAAAQVCALFGVPFAALRAISDDGGDNAVTSFYEFLHTAAANNARAVCRLLQGAPR
ncbi:MAG: 5'-methylthioadenosine/adenosylhomocysteine nucleosidase [Clostridia bacterium]|nr:5'-methylthioadenosine/adenosylhomocysteine nucleosidase [Clostridia bacterium]